MNIGNREERSNPIISLAIGSLGVVYGDIGTSPLYAIRTCFQGLYRIQPTAENVFAIVSVIIWSLIIIISLKYLIIVMKADNRGEGRSWLSWPWYPHGKSKPPEGP